MDSGCRWPAQWILWRVIWPPGGIALRLPDQDGINMPLSEIRDNIPILVTAIAAAFIGAILGRRLLRKVTITVLQYFVALGISIVGILLMIGIL